MRAAARRREPGHRRGVRRAVVMVPNGFTLFNLLCGIYAIVLSIRGDVGAAPAWIVAGGIADAFDGRVARATGTGSRFGAELDSLVDAISFGLAPALIVFLGQPAGGPGTQGNLDWLLVFIYSACAVMRLARFNVEQAGRAKTHFHGLPSPAAGLTLATYYWFSQTPLYRETVILFTDGTTLAQLPWHNLLRGLMAILAALMISDVPYPAMPSIGFNSIKKILGTVMVVGSIALLIFVRKEFIFPALVVYVLYGVIKWMIIGFAGRASTPDEIFWQREAELHQEDEDQALYDRPPLGKEMLQEVADDDDDETLRLTREGRPTRDQRDIRERDGRPARTRREPREGREPREAREAREAREPREGREGREARRPKNRDEARRKEGRRDEPRKPQAPKEPRPETPRDQARAEEPRVETAPRAESRVEDRLAEQVAIENEPSLGLPEDLGAEQSDVERREPERKPDDELQVRKRRRRRRGNRNRGDRERGDASGDASGDGSHDASAEGGESDGPGSDVAAGDDSVASPSGGDNPPGPPRPETPDPSGTTE